MVVMCCAPCNNVLCKVVVCCAPGVWRRSWAHSNYSGMLFRRFLLILLFCRTCCHADAWTDKAVTWLRVVGLLLLVFQATQLQTIVDMRFNGQCRLLDRTLIAETSRPATSMLTTYRWNRIERLSWCSLTSTLRFQSLLAVLTYFACSSALFRIRLKLLSV